MKLHAEKRAAERKSEAKKHRREGKIPAILYSKGQIGEPLVVPEPEFAALLRTLEDGALANTVLTLALDGKERAVLVKGIQYHPTTYNIIHLDFEELHDDTKVRLRIPLRLTGSRECVGVQHGGVIRPVIRHVSVECLPKDIPSKFSLDVRNLEIKGKRRLSEIAIPENVRPLANLSEVAVVIAKR
jgi:large subunit ribosomal protein L25